MKWLVEFVDNNHIDYSIDPWEVAAIKGTGPHHSKIYFKATEAPLEVKLTVGELTKIINKGRGVG